MEKKEKLRQISNQLKLGYELVSQKKYSEAKDKLGPYVPIFHTKEKPNIRLMGNYCLAQFGSGDIDGFLHSYAELKDSNLMNPTEKELTMIRQIDELFTVSMEYLGRSE
ncbi:hypothetical protein ACJ2A9_16420 [Anaerobacillus sp. MEB173]|uniref:hypothetical protein n=1 Tax=Anaerobacillus sp. MEB173 TaxID=3383345 RepID=UPI003F93CF98